MHDKDLKALPLTKTCWASYNAVKQTYYILDELCHPAIDCTSDHHRKLPSTLSD